MSEAKHARRYYISGMVQGVGYRFFVQDEAERIGVSGYVRNLRDGRVEAYAIGFGKQLAEFCAVLGRGPMMSRVAHVAEEPGEFDARYAGDFVIEQTV